MRDKIFTRHLQTVALGIFLVFGICSNSEAFDFSDWDTLIKKHVVPKTVDGILINAVDYPSLKKDPLFSDLANRLKSYPLEGLGSENSKLTFWINTYNILAAKMITDHYPIESIKDAGIEDLEIYLVANRMFMIMKVNDTFSFEKKGEMDANNPKVQEWETLMWEYQQALPMAKEGEKWMLMDKIYQL